MRICKLKDFARSAAKAGLDDDDLREAVERAERGHVDASLGKFLVKQRIGRENQDRAGGYRTILLHKVGDLVVFLHMFAKNRQATLTPVELRVFRSAAKQIGGLSSIQIDALIGAGEWIEVDDGRHRQELSQRPASVGPSGDGGPAQGRRDR